MTTQDPLLRLPYLRVTGAITESYAPHRTSDDEDESSEVRQRLRIVATYDGPRPCCCGALRSHGRRTIEVGHTPIGGMPSYLVIERPRFR